MTKKSYPGAPEGSGKPGPSSVKRRSLYLHWQDVMVPALSGKFATEHVARPTFYANVKSLKEKRGLSEEKIMELVTEFARQVSIGQIDVRFKSPWFVFMRAWPRLGGSASSEGLAKHIATKTENEDWT